MGLGGQFAGASRESLLLANNVLLTIAMAAVLLGTLYPLVLDTLNLGKISVGPPYFDTRVLPADGAGRLPHGDRPAGELEEGAAPGPRARA